MKIIDYISETEINATPEEMDSVQPISIELVENLNYPKETVQTRPQYMVKRSPSDTKKFPVDIVVFDKDDKTKPYLIVECKRKEKKDGLDQLKIYLSMSEANIGVWDNGNERVILQKIHTKKGIDFEAIPTIPKFGESIESIGNYTKNDLVVAKDLKSKFKSLRNWLAANNSGATRDETIASQLIYIIFCKILDEKNTGINEKLTFTRGINEPIVDVVRKIKSLWKTVKEESVDIFNSNDKISLDDNSIAYIVGELQQYHFMKSDRHVMSEAFETFIGHSLKGEQGQFFTPRNVIELAIKIANPNEKSKIIDPACGTGGFLIEATKYVWNKLEIKSEEKGWEREYLISEQKKYAIENVYGLDKDEFLAKVTKAYMMLIGDGKSGIFNTNSLNPKKWTNRRLKEEVVDGTFDFVFANPPYGSKIKITDKETLKQYTIIKKAKDTPPQTLFIERMFNLLKEGGVMAIVMPDSLLGNKTSDFEREFISDNGVVKAVISLPIETFQPHTGTKTSLILIEKTKQKNKNREVFIAAPRTCGHNRRGDFIESDEVSEIYNLYKEWSNEN